MNFWARFPCQIWAQEKLPFFIPSALPSPLRLPPSFTSINFCPFVTALTQSNLVTGTIVR